MTQMSVHALFLQRDDMKYGTEQDGRTPLHCAAAGGSLDVTSFLLDQKADVNARDLMAWTPLMVAGVWYCSIAQPGRYVKVPMTTIGFSERRA